MPETSAARYVGRFAPSPTGPLHAGSLAAALASWLDARAHGGQWLLRIEDVDTPRCVPGADRIIIRQLADCGLLPQEAPLYQSQRAAHYQAALDQLVGHGRAYPCACSRQDIELAVQIAGHGRTRGSELIYPGTCRCGLAGKPARSWRLRVSEFISNKPFDHEKRAQAAPDFISNNTVTWTDRALGEQSQNVHADVGDFVLKRADGLWAYQLAVVADDAAQGVTHIVRGADLADNSARQILLQRALRVPQPHYLHTPVVNGEDGKKLSKQNGAAAVDTSEPLLALQDAGTVLGIHLCEKGTSSWLAAAAAVWAARYVPRPA